MPIDKSAQVITERRRSRTRDVDIIVRRISRRGRRIAHLHISVQNKICVNLYSAAHSKYCTQRNVHVYASVVHVLITV